MSYPFEVHPDPMTRESNRLLDAVERSASEQNAHHGELEAAVPKMWGQSKGALQAAHTALTDQSRILHKNLTEHGMSMQAFTGQVVETEEQGRERMYRAGEGL